MDYSIYQVDAFTDSLFKGNPACVVPLDRWLEDDILLNIAKENAVPETAFFVQKNNEIHLRWFTPDIEMDLCGHATLATAHVIKKHLQYQGEILKFKTLSGIVKVSISSDKYFLDFPSRMPVATSLPNNLKEALNLIPNRVLKSRDYVLVYENEAAVRNIQIKRNLFDTLNLGTGGVVVTSRGKKSRFCISFFHPKSYFIGGSCYRLITLLINPLLGL
jgi:predicted PhzF superfamily epimerase YddE/YHI9